MDIVFKYIVGLRALSKDCIDHLNYERMKDGDFLHLYLRFIAVSVGR